jgi:hypothetical protein
MNRAATLSALLFAASAFGGVTYDFHSQTTGLQRMTLEGSVAVEGPQMRMTLTTGDGMVFKSGSIILSHDGGKNLSVFDPATKTYYQMPLDEMLGGAGAALKNSPVEVKFEHPNVTVREGGDGGTIEGLPTQKLAVDASIDIVIDAMGQKLTSKMALSTESWTTDKLDANAVNVFQQRGVRTGIDALDKLIESQGSAFKGRFPLKSVSTVHIVQNGRDLASTTTATVTNVKQGAVGAGEFKEPAGYARTDNPVDAMKKRN